jgi:hypothetical protein
MPLLVKLAFCVGCATPHLFDISLSLEELFPTAAGTGGVVTAAVVVVCVVVAAMVVAWCVGAASMIVVDMVARGAVLGAVVVWGSWEGIMGVSPGVWLQLRWRLCVWLQRQC